jgi:predicted component of type VI protein secretion system
MSATSSKKSATKTAAPAAVAVPVPTPTPAPAAKAAKAPKAVKAEAAPAPAAAVAAEPVAAEAEGATDGSVLLKNIEELSEQLSGLKATLQTALLGLKTLEKQAARVVKKADRRGRRKAEAVEGAPKKPCIFTQPVKISEELCSFLALSKGTEVSRSAVTKAVMAYARSHSLMDKQTIKADAPLRKLLSLKDSDPQLTILNLQTYLSRHYVKAVPVAK